MSSITVALRQNASNEKSEVRQSSQNILAYKTLFKFQESRWSFQFGFTRATSKVAQHLFRTFLELRRQYFKCLNKTDKYQLRTFYWSPLQPVLKPQKSASIFKAHAKHFCCLGIRFFFCFRACSHFTEYFHWLRSSQLNPLSRCERFTVFWHRRRRKEHSEHIYRSMVFCICEILT